MCLCVLFDVLCVVVVCVMVWFCYAYACLLKCVYVLCEVECDVVWFGFC